MKNNPKDVIIFANNLWRNSDKAIVQTYKTKISQLLEDLHTCEGTEGYEEAMNWSRQYAALQAKSIQADLEVEYGAAEAKKMVEQAMEMVLA